MRRFRLLEPPHPILEGRIHDSNRRRRRVKLSLVSIFFLATSFLSLVFQGLQSAPVETKTITRQRTGAVGSGNAGLNITTFGARGDGRTDDTQAVQAAINAAKASHEAVFFPLGTYLVKAPLNLTGMSAVKIVGAQSSGSVAQVAGSATTIVYGGPPLSKGCPFDFSDSTWIWISDISFTSSSPVACVVLLGSSRSESEDIHFENVSIGEGSVASLADAGAEVVEFSHSSLAYGRGIGLLLSSNGLSGYGISSPFGLKFGARSMTQVTFRGGKIVSGSGHAVELDGTGNASTIPVADVSFFGTYIAGSGSGGSAFYLKGVIWALTDIAQRFEIDSQTGPAYFIHAAQGARVVSLNVTGLNISPSAPKPYYALYSPNGPSNPVITGGVISGVSVPVDWAGNIINLDLKDNNKLDIRIAGNAVFCRFRATAGINSFYVSGRLQADIQGWKNVVKFVPLYSNGSADFIVRQSGHYIATYASDLCAFDADVGPSGISIGNVNYMSGQLQFSNNGLGVIGCPHPGVKSSVVVTARYSNTGDFFIVRIM
jgi:hypothetical protein